MKKLLLLLPLAASLFMRAQTNYPSSHINLLGMIAPNTTDMANDNRRYSGCWGWFQQSKNKEYAISGTSKGTYFIDITAPASPSICAYVEGGREGCIWRELKSYSHYCYVVSDDPAPNKFQIIDMQYLPDSVHVVYNSNTFFERAHTIWIDGNKMYVGGVTYTNGATPATSPMAVFSLANPEAPVLLRRMDQDIPTTVANYVHDMFVRNDTVYASCANQGLQVLKFNSAATTPSFTQLGSYANYEQAGYNHSSSLTRNGKYLVFCDESPAGLPVHMVDVENLSNIQPVQVVNPYPGTTPHNPYVLNNDFVVIASYQDGLLIYKITDPLHIGMTGYFDTYPQGGNNTGTYSGQDYRGNWGAYPFLPSGHIIAQDMQNGVFILDASEAFNSPVGIKTNQAEEISLMAYPNPVADRLAVSYNIRSATTLQLKDMLGRVVYEKTFTGPVNEYLDVKNFENGCYLLSISDNNRSRNRQVIITH